MLDVKGMGRLTKEPELRFTQTGAGVCTMQVAFDTNYNSKEKKMNTTFLKVVVWNRGENKLAERCAEWLDKGMRILVSGYIEVRSYEKEGKKQYITELIAEKIDFIDKKSKQNTLDNATEEKFLDFSDFGQEVKFENDLPF